MRDIQSEHKLTFHDGVRGSHRPIAGGTIALSSSTAGWQGVELEYYRQTDLALEQGFLRDPLVILHLGGPCLVQSQAKGQNHSQEVGPGTVTLLPAGRVELFRCWGTPELLLLSLGRAMIMCATAEAGAPGNVEFPMQIGTKDQLAGAMLAKLKTLLESGAGSSESVYAASLCQSLVVHLVRDRSHTPNPAGVRQNGLSRMLLKQTLDFIYANSTRNVTLKEIADIVEMSPFHFSRMFKRSTGDSPYQHLLRHRVGRGAELLLTSREGVARIATRIGFSDQSHFTSHFKRFYGVTPREFVRRHRS